MADTTGLCIDPAHVLWLPHRDAHIEMPDATERAQTHLSLRSLSSPDLPEVEEDRGLIPYNLWSINSYFTIGGAITADDQFPVSLALKVEGNSEGNKPILRSIPWEPLTYEYRIAEPASRWVAGNDYVIADAQMAVQHWYDSMNSQIIRTLEPVGRVKSLISLYSQTPAYSYRGRDGWVDCDAVSLLPTAAMRTQIGASDYLGFGFAAVGTFDKAGESPYRVLIMETVSATISVVADGVGRLVLMEGDTEIAAMSGRQESGVPMALLFALNAKGATACLIDSYGGRSLVSAPVSPEIFISIKSMVVGAPLRTDNELMEVVFWDQGEPLLRLVAQLMAVLAYYRNRRPE